MPTLLIFVLSLIAFSSAQIVTLNSNTGIQQELTTLGNSLRINLPGSSLGAIRITVNGVYQTLSAAGQPLAVMYTQQIFNLAQLQAPNAVLQTAEILTNQVSVSPFYSTNIVAALNDVIRGELAKNIYWYYATSPLSVYSTIDSILATATSYNIPISTAFGVIQLLFVQSTLIQQTANQALTSISTMSTQIFNSAIAYATKYSVPTPNGVVSSLLKLRLTSAGFGGYLCAGVPGILGITGNLAPNNYGPLNLLSAFLGSFGGGIGAGLNAFLNNQGISASFSAAENGAFGYSQLGAVTGDPFILFTSIVDSFNGNYGTYTYSPEPTSIPFGILGEFLGATIGNLPGILGSGLNLNAISTSILFAAYNGFLIGTTKTL